MWYCNRCEKEIIPTIYWGTAGGQKVDVLDMFCPTCISDDEGTLVWKGTREEKDTWWNKEYEK